ncbi:hypothetical protein CSB69_1064 [Morganella morganii]|nr:hypothetical protein CSB69_1064 [Morganella morganii]
MIEPGRILIKNFKTTYEDKMICFSKQKVMLLCKRNNNF